MILVISIEGVDNILQWIDRLRGQYLRFDTVTTRRDQGERDVVPSKGGLNMVHGQSELHSADRIHQVATSSRISDKSMCTILRRDPSQKFKILDRSETPSLSLLFFLPWTISPLLITIPRLKLPPPAHCCTVKIVVYAHPTTPNTQTT